MENGEELKSGVFSIRTKDRQTDWFMRINPNGEEKTCKGFVSLFLYKDGNCEVVEGVEITGELARLNIGEYLFLAANSAPLQVPINADIIFSIVDKDGVKTRAKRSLLSTLQSLNSRSYLST